MPVETDTSTSTSGGTTTVGADVRDGPGPGGKKRELDVYLHIDPAKLEQVSAPTGPAADELRVDKDRLSAYWKKVVLPAGGSLSFSWRVKKRSGDAFEGASDGLLVVADRATKGTFIVRRFCICGNTDRLVLFDKFGPYKVSDSHFGPNVITGKKRKKTTRKSARKTRKTATPKSKRVRR